MMNQKLLIPIILIFNNILSAQSFFNTEGLGEITAGNTATTPCALSWYNPGAYIHLPKTQLGVSLSGTGAIGKEQEMTRAIFNVRPAAFYGAIPLPTRTRIIFNVDEAFNQEFDIWTQPSSDTSPRYHIQARGGIYSLNIGLAQSFLDHFCLGAQFQQYLGGARENWHFHIGSAPISTDTIEIDYSASSARLGASVQFNPITFAASYEPAKTITARRLRHIHGITGDSIRSYKIQLPHTLLLGIAAPILPNIHFNLGLDLHPWANTKIDGINAGYQNGINGRLGVEYILPSNHPLRLAYSMDKWYCPVKSTRETIQEKGLNIGTAIPVPQFGTIDLTGQIVFRQGNTPSGILKETVGRIIFTLVYQETWGKRTRRWGY